MQDTDGPSCTSQPASTMAQPEPVRPLPTRTHSLADISASLPTSLPTAPPSPPFFASEQSRSSSPGARSRPKSIFARLRRLPQPSAIPIPMSAQSHLGQASFEHAGVARCPSGDKENAKERPRLKGWDKIATRKAPAPPGPVGHTLRRVAAREIVLEDDGEMEWERIKTLPRVRLIPPEEDEDDPVTLYPPPHPRPLIYFEPETQPIQPPTLVEAVVQSMINQPTSQPQPTRTPIAPVGNHNMWGGMASGFSQAAPVFNRRHQGSAIVMPKRAGQVAADIQQKRLSRVYDHDMSGSPTSDTDSLTEKPASPPATTMERPPTPPPSALSTTMNPDRSKVMSPPPIPPILEEPREPEEVSPLPPVASTLAEINSPLQSPPLSPKKFYQRKIRSMSLTSALAAKIQSIIPDDEDVPPPVPSLPSQGERLRKQKSLKFLFSSADHLPLEEQRARHQEKERKPKGFLARVKSKPSLVIDVKAARLAESETGGTPITPGLATGSSSGQSETAPTTPESAIPSGRVTPGLSKRFSLSNMSSAFKKVRPPGSNSGVPSVPALPEAYKREKPRVLESQVPMSPASTSTTLPFIPYLGDTNTRCDSGGPSTARESNACASQSSPRQTLSSPQSADCADCDDQSPKTSSLFGQNGTSPTGSPSFSENFAHSQLMHVSPRTRLNPGVSLQEFLSSVPSPKTVLIQKRVERRSLQAIVIGPLLLPDDLPTVPETSDSPEFSLSFALARLSRQSMLPFSSTRVAPPAPIILPARSQESVLHRGRPCCPMKSDSDTSINSLSSSSSSADDAFPSPVPLTPSILSPAIELSTTLPCLLSEAVLVESPSGTDDLDDPPTTTSRQSTPASKNPFSSPEAFLRLISSPKHRAKATPPHHGQGQGHEQGQRCREDVGSGKGSGIPIPPIPDRQEASSLEGDVQLKSLHFESLGLDFDGYGWARGGVAQ